MENEYNFNILARYVHGSEDSTDLDVIYVVDSLPDKGTCKKWCDRNREENRNLIVIKDGIVSEVYKGSPDEVNNALLETYKLHEQEYPLLIEKKVERNLELKAIRSMRMILSHLSRTEFRPWIKEALRSGWDKRMETLHYLIENWGHIIINDKGHNMSAKDILKVVAFQLGQTMALFDGEELYTKSKIAAKYPYLHSYLYREDEALERNNYGIVVGLWRYFYLLSTFDDVQIDYSVQGAKDEPEVKFKKSGNIYDLTTETLLYCELSSLTNFMNLTWKV